MTSFKKQALNNTLWSFAETFGNQGVQFLIGIVLARLLMPSDFGIVGVLAVFMGLSGVLIDSGFKTSIIRGKDINDIDCSTIFYVNFLVSILVGLSLFLSAHSIAVFFNKSELENVTKLLAIIPVINGLGLVQSALLYRNLEFKRNAKASVLSNFFAGIVALILAFQGFSYWSLVWRGIISAIIYNGLLWIGSNWRPKLEFSFQILKKHYRFSIKLLITGIIDAFFSNVYSFIFGKFFSFSELGFFTRGKSYVDMITRTLSIAISKVNLPLLSIEGSSDVDKINRHIKLLRATTIIIFPATILLMAIAEPMIIFLIGTKWLPAVPYLQILAISGLIYPILNANSNLVLVFGRSDYTLKAALISRMVQLVILFTTIRYGGIIVAWGIIIHNIFGLFISFYFIKKTIKQNILNMVKSLISPLIISVIMGVFVFITGYFLKHFFITGYILAIQLLVGVLVLWPLMQVFKISEYFFIKQSVMTFISKHKNF